MVGWLSCLWAHGKAEQHSRDWVVEENTYLIVSKKQREREEGWGLNISFKGTLDLTSFHRPYLLKVPPPPNSAISWQPNPWMTFKIKTLKLSPIFFSFLFLFVCVCVCGTGVWTQGFALVRQELYLLHPASNPTFLIMLCVLVLLERGVLRSLATIVVLPVSFQSH
jgi:hypothetical protein